MLKLAFFLVSVLIILNVWGYSASSQDNANAMMNLIPKTNSKLERIQEVQSTVEASVLTKLDVQLLAIQERMNGMEENIMALNSDMKNQFQLLLTKITDQQTSMQTKMDAQILEVKKVLEVQKTTPEPHSSETKLNRTEEQLPMTETEIDGQPAELQNTTGNHHIVEDHTTIKSKTIDQRFELIGSRYFYIEHYIEKTWDEAAETCRGMGGYLAAFKTQEELTAVIQKLKKGNFWYWTGINDLNEEGKFISTASGKPATVLKWESFDPDGHCVFIYMWDDEGKLADFDCRYKVNFICQSDNET